MNKTLSAILFLIVFLNFPDLLLAQQKNWHRFKELSMPEKRWVIAHLFVAKKTLKLTDFVVNEAKLMGPENGLDAYDSGGKKDAFRHAYWMAVLSSQLGWKKVRALGRAHELGNKKAFDKNVLEHGFLPDYVSMKMDHWNNDVGILIGRENKKASNDCLKKLVLNHISEGKCKIIKRNKEGLFLDKEGSVLKEIDWKGKWTNSKCLVASNK